MRRKPDIFVMLQGLDELNPTGMSDRTHVKHTLLLSIYFQEGIDFVIIQSSDLAGSQIHADCCQSKALSDVSGIQVDISVCPLFFPLF
jgi:hypothetical protein